MDARGWSDLSTGELVARLVNRGLEPWHAEGLARRRDEPETARLLDRMLGCG